MTLGYLVRRLALIVPIVIVLAAVGMARAADQQLQTPVPVNPKHRVLDKPLDRPVPVEEQSGGSQDETKGQKRSKNRLRSPDLPEKELEPPTGNIRRPTPAPGTQQGGASEGEANEQERRSTGLEPPDLRDEEVDRQLDETRRRIPAHAPSWSDRQERQSGNANAPPKAAVPPPPAPPVRGQRVEPRGGAVQFGDGEHGRRPDARDRTAPGYRYGGGRSGQVPDARHGPPGGGGFTPRPQAPRTQRSVPVPTVVSTPAIRMTGYGTDLPAAGDAPTFHTGTDTIRMTGQGGG